jgi:hypothetical protein
MCDSMLSHTTSDAILSGLGMACCPLRPILNCHMTSTAAAAYDGDTMEGPALKVFRVGPFRPRSQ